MGVAGHLIYGWDDSETTVLIKPKFWLSREPEEMLETLLAVESCYSG